MRLLEDSSWRLFGTSAWSFDRDEADREEDGTEKPDTMPSLIERTTAANNGNNFIMVKAEEV